MKIARLAGAFVVGLLSSASPAQPISPSTPSIVRDTYVETSPGVRIHVLEAGAATHRPPLVLIPGWRLTASLWRQQMEVLSRDGRVIALDPRSQGDSTITPEGDTPEQRARDYKVVLAKLAPGPVVLVGFSQGVQDVAAFVNQFGTGSLKGIVLVDSTVSSGADSLVRNPQIAAQQLKRLAAYVRDPRSWTEGMMRAIIRRPLSEAEFSHLVDDALKTPAAIGASMLVDDLLGPDRTQALAKMNVPTLVIASAASPELDGQREMAGKLPLGRFETIADAAHAVFIDQPERFHTIVRDFLSTLDSSAADRPPVGARGLAG